MEDNKNQEILFICSCGDAEHQLIMRYDEDEKFPEYSDVYVDVHLSQCYSFWKRLKMAIKYLFGYKCMYGDFDEFIFKPSDWKKLDKVVKYLKKIDLSRK